MQSIIVIKGLRYTHRALLLTLQTHTHTHVRIHTHIHSDTHAHTERERERERAKPSWCMSAIHFPPHVPQCTWRHVVCHSYTVLWWCNHCITCACVASINLFLTVFIVTLLHHLNIIMLHIGDNLSIVRLLFNFSSQGFTQLIIDEWFLYDQHHSLLAVALISHHFSLHLLIIDIIILCAQLITIV